MFLKFKAWLALPLTVWLLATACRESAKGPAVLFVDQSEVAGGIADQQTDPLMLMVSIDSRGKLRLNRIETGTIDDTTVLGEKLTAVFNDRGKSSIAEREVLVEMEGTVRHVDLETLIAALTEAGASPINVIKE